MEGGVWIENGIMKEKPPGQRNKMEKNEGDGGR